MAVTILQTDERDCLNDDEEEYLTRCVDGIDRCDNQTSLGSSQGGDRELWDIRQTNGDYIVVVHTELQLKSNRKGRTVIPELRKCVLSVRNATDLQK